MLLLLNSSKTTEIGHTDVATIVIYYLEDGNTFSII